MSNFCSVRRFTDECREHLVGLGLLVRMRMDNLGSVIGRQASLPQDEDRGAYNFKDCEANERDRRWSHKKHAPDNSEQDGLSLDSGNEPIQSEAQSEPHSVKKPQIAVEQRVCR